MNREIDIDPMQMPVCPICDNGMVDGEQVEIVFSFMGKALGLAHTDCIDERTLNQHSSEQVPNALREPHAGNETTETLK